MSPLQSLTGTVFYTTKPQVSEPTTPTKAPQPAKLGSDAGSQYLSIRYSTRLAEAGVEPSVGSVGDSYDNALAESVIGLYKTELIRPREPWRNLDQVEYATLEYDDQPWGTSVIANSRTLHSSVFRVEYAWGWRSLSDTRKSGHANGRHVAISGRHERNSRRNTACAPS